MANPWTTNDNVSDDLIWSAPEEQVTEEDFDDLQLVRMGIDIPCSREWVDNPPPRYEPRRERVSDRATMEQLRELLDVWTTNTESNVTQDFVEDFIQNNISGTGISFVDPDVAGFDMTPEDFGIRNGDLIHATDIPLQDAVDASIEDDGDYCHECGSDWEHCHCDEEDVNRCRMCGEDEWYCECYETCANCGHDNHDCRC